MSQRLDGAEQIRREMEAEVRQAMIHARTMLDASEETLTRLEPAC